MTKLTKDATLSQLIKNITMHEVAFNSEDLKIVTWVVGHTPQDEFSRIINGSDEKSKSALFFLLSNVWTYQAVTNFWKTKEKA